MKKVNHIGKILAGIGVLYLFRKVDGFYGFGGYVNNTWEILLVSLILIIIGFSMILISRHKMRIK